MFWKYHMTASEMYSVHPCMTSDLRFQFRFWFFFFCSTWTGPAWSPAQSISSVLISIQSLMTENPYHNEPGFEQVLQFPKCTFLINFLQGKIRHKSLVYAFCPLELLCFIFDHICTFICLLGKASRGQQKLQRVYPTRDHACCCVWYAGGQSAVSRGLVVSDSASSVPLLNIFSFVLSVLFLSL